MTDASLHSPLSPELTVIARLVPEGARVLDIGCGSGELLAHLTAHTQVDGHGMELSHTRVGECLSKGLTVIQGDADHDLAYYADAAFDVAIMSGAMQALRRPDRVLEHMARIARRAIVSIPNFGYWPNRFYLLYRGRMPVTSRLAYQWYETPNIHFSTIKDFIILCEERGLVVEKRLALDADGHPAPFRGHGWLANWFAPTGVFVLRGKMPEQAVKGHGKAKNS